MDPVTHIIAGALGAQVVRRPYEGRFIIFYLPILVHIFLDLITSYGTQIFFPFTNRRYSLECVFIIDPFYTFLMVIILYLSVRSKINKKKIAILGLVWVFLYPIANLGIRYTLQNSIEDDLKKKRIVFERVHVLSEAFTPFSGRLLLKIRHTMLSIFV